MSSVIEDAVVESDQSFLRFDLKVLDAVLDRLPLGIIVLDEQGRVQIFNQYEQQLSGRRPEKVLGRSFFDEIAPCTRDIHLKERFFDGIHHNNLAIDLDFEFPSPYNAVPRSVRIRALSIDAGPKPVHTLLVEDITMRKNLEQSSQELTVRLRDLLVRYMGRGYAQELEQAPEGDIGVQEKEAIVLFADLTGFTAYSSTLSPAQLFSRLNTRIRTAIGAVLRYGGVLDKLLGDGLLAYFLPREVDDRHIWDALRAARDIVRPDDPKDCPLPFRVGIASGSVVIGTIGSREFGNVTVLGHTVNLAKRLQEAAQPGEVMVSAELAARAGGVMHSTAILELVLKGLADIRLAHRMDRLDLP